MFSTTSSYLPSIISFDSSLLTGWFQVQQTASSLAAFRAVNGGVNPEVQFPGQGAVEDILPPWDYRQEQTTFDERVAKAMKAGSLFDTSDPFFDQDMPEEHRELFKAYKALSRLQTLAEFAAKETTFDGRLPGLDTRFQPGLTELTSFISALKTESFLLSNGIVEDKVDSGMGTPGFLNTHTGQIAQSGAYDDAIAGLTGTEVFTVSVAKFGTVTDVVIDLANVSGTLNLDNIADYINQELSAAGVVSSVSRVRVYDEAAFEEDQDPEDPKPLPSTFGFEIQGVSTETLSFSAAASDPAIYLAGTNGIRDTEVGQLIKLTDIASGTPVSAASSRIVPTQEETTANAVASAIDSEGHIYVLGNTDGSLGKFNNQGEQDLYLRKFDSTGAVIWEQMLGATQTAEGFGLAVDGDDNIVVVGAVRGDLSSSAIGGGEDSFVTKYASNGQELFTRQLSPGSNDGARDVAVASDGSIFLTGYTSSAFSSDETHGGAKDGYVTKLDEDGNLLFTRQFGGASDDLGEAIAVDVAGDVFIASVEAGNVVVTKYSGADDTSAALWSSDLGALGNGQIGGITVENGKVYVAGSTDETGFGSSVVAAHSADKEDGFLVGLSDNGSSGGVDFTTFVSGGDVDRIGDVTVSGGKVYIAGETQGDVSGNGLVGKIDGFVAQYDVSGSEDWTHQYSGQGGYAKAQSLVIDEGGSSVLDLLGFAKGEIEYSQARTITANSTVRPGQYFYLSVDGGRQQKISIDDDETFRSLTFKINAALGFDGKSRVRKTGEGDFLRIEVNDGVRVDLTPGAEGFDALAGLGIKVGTLYNDGSLLDDDKDPEDEGPLIFGLGLENGLALGNKTDAAYALEILSEAMSQLRDVYREITKDPALEALINGQKGMGGPVPAYLTAQLSNYQAGLARLASGPTTSIFG